MTLIPIMIPLQAPGQAPPVLPGESGVRPPIFFDARKQAFHTWIRVPVSRRTSTNARHYASLRKHSKTERRLSSRLARKRIDRVGSKTILGRQSKTLLDSSIGLRKTSRLQNTSYGSLGRHKSENVGNQASIIKTGRREAGSRASLSRKQDKRIGTATKLKRQKQNRMEARAEPEDDTELLAALDE